LRSSEERRKSQEGREQEAAEGFEKRQSDDDWEDDKEGYMNGRRAYNQ
jgi:hypothetical protein